MADDRKTRTNRVPEEDGEPSLLLDAWRALGSIRTTIVLLPIIAAATTIGAIVPQRQPAALYEVRYGETVGGLLPALGFDDLYVSTWFLILIALLLLNLAACVAASWRRAARRYRGPAAEPLARKLGDHRAASCWSGQSDNPCTIDDAVAGLRRPSARVDVRTEGRRTNVLVRRWPWAAYGGIVTHLAVFAIAIGAVLGALPWTSLDERITIAEGETHTDTDDKLGYDVRLDDFRMDFYEETGAPSSYESDVVLLSEGRELTRGTATVNEQVAYGSVSLGQSSWALAGLKLIISAPGGEEVTATLPLVPDAGSHGGRGWGFDPRRRFALLADGASAVVGMDFVADAAEEDGEIVGSWSLEYPRNPAVYLQVVSGLSGEDHSFEELGWLKLGDDANYDGQTVRFEDLVYVSTLSARRDLGLPFVWGGFILVSLGMIVMFYVRPRAFLVQLQEQDGAGLSVRVAPHARELEETDRHFVEAAIHTNLTPMSRKVDSKPN